jgi:hypothetical protein
MTERQRLIVYAALILALCLVASGCGTTSAQRGGTGGSALGALAGGLIGGDWAGAAIGAAVGGGVGYMVGNEQDKKKAQEEARRERAELARARVTSDPKTAYRPLKKYPLVGSTWRVISIVSEKPYPEFSSMVVTFQTNSKMTTLAAFKNGTTDTTVESYRIVDDVMVISGKDYMINGKYSIEKGQMIFVSPEMRVVLEEVE